MTTQIYLCFRLIDLNNSGRTHGTSMVDQNKYENVRLLDDAVS